MNGDNLVHELKVPISDHPVPQLPAPDAGLARALAALSPPTALTYSTPWVRVPVSAVPAIDDQEAELHQERASNIRLAGLTAKERNVATSLSTRGQRAVSDTTRSRACARGSLARLSAPASAGRSHSFLQNG